jgi:hypothetical protein
MIMMDNLHNTNSHIMVRLGEIPETYNLHSSTYYMLVRAV